MSVEHAIGRYSLIEKLGEGGMATVYMARLVGAHTWSRKVALKVIRPELAMQPDFNKWFIGEALLGSCLSHVNIVPTLDFGEADGRLFLAMEYIHGPTLQDVLDRLRRGGRELPLEVALQILIQICHGLEYAHTAIDHEGRPLRMVHRDLKPSNILLSRDDGTVRITDFGVARAETNLLQTQSSGIIKGTLRYMSPEQAEGRRGIDHRSDLFTVGIIAYELFTLRPLYEGEAQGAVLRQAMDARVEPGLSRLPEGPYRERLLAFLSRTLAAEPDARFQSAGEMAGCLKSILATMSTSGELKPYLTRLLEEPGSMVAPATQTPSPAPWRTPSGDPLPSPASMQGPVPSSTAPSDRTAPSGAPSPWPALPSPEPSSDVMPTIPIVREGSRDPTPAPGQPSGDTIPERPPGVVTEPPGGGAARARIREDDTSLPVFYVKGGRPWSRRLVVAVTLSAALIALVVWLAPWDERIAHKDGAGATDTRDSPSSPQPAAPTLQPSRPDPSGPRASSTASTTATEEADGAGSSAAAPQAAPNRQTGRTQTSSSSSASGPKIGARTTGRAGTRPDGTAGVTDPRPASSPAGSDVSPPVEPTSASVALGTLIVNAIPAHAIVTIDGALVSDDLPATLTRRPGPYKIVISLGHRRYEKQIRVVAGGAVTCFVNFRDDRFLCPVE